MKTRLPSEKLQNDLLAAHRELGRKLTGLQKWWLQVDQLGRGPDYDGFAIRLRETLKLLEEHFRQEEADEYLAPALCSVAELADRAAKLQAEHQVFLERANALLERLTSPIGQRPAWKEAGRDVDQLVSDIRRHELAENELIYTYLEKDVPEAD